MGFHMLSTVFWKWLATFLGVMGGVMISLNIPEITRYGFIPFLFSSVIWIFVAVKMNERSLVMLNATFIIINVTGIYQWFS